MGPDQRKRLAWILERLAGEPLKRIVMIHHPPTTEGLRPRRRLTDATIVRDLLVNVGADLVLHGHTHDASVEHLQTPTGPIPVIGVRSSSAIGQRPDHRAQYHLYRLDRRRGAPITIIVRGYDRERGCFVPLGEREL